MVAATSVPPLLGIALRQRCGQPEAGHHGLGDGDAADGGHRLQELPARDIRPSLNFLMKSCTCSFCKLTFNSPSKLFYSL